MSSPANDELATTVLLKRYECLNALINHPQAKPELVDTLDMPSFNSLMMSFVSSNKQILVEYRDGDWYSTQSGRLACRAHRNYLDQLDNLGDVSSVLDFMDTDEEVS